MEYSRNDKIFKKLNKKIESLSKENDFYGMAVVYYEMAHLVMEEGDDPQMYKDLGYKMKLKHQVDGLKSYQISGVVDEVECLVNIGSCSVCKKLKGEKLRLSDELSSPSIPVKHCENRYDGCGCTYIPIIE